MWNIVNYFAHTFKSETSFPWDAGNRTKLFFNDHYNELYYNEFLLFLKHIYSFFCPFIHIFICCLIVKFHAFSCIILIVCKCP